MTEITVVGAGGEYMEAVVVVEWHKKPGERVEAGETVVTVETAKAATEIEAPASGVLAEIRADIGEEIEVGGVLGIIGDGVTAASAVPSDVSVPASSVSPARTGSDRAMLWVRSRGARARSDLSSKHRRHSRRCSA